MTKVRLASTNRALALLAVFALAACGSPTADGDVTAPEGTEAASSFGAQLPGSEPEDAPETPAPAAAPAPPAEQAAMPDRPMPFRGINLAGAEFGDVLPGKDGKDYAFPSTSEVDYYMSKGMNTFRVGFKWERLQKKALGKLDEKYAAKLYALVSYATSKGATVILNPHNFARYYGKTVGSAQVPNAVFADLWARLATQWASDPKVMFNLVNEPHTIATEQWVDASNEAIAAIRATGAKNAVVVPGNSWTGAHSWASDSYGTPNSVALLDIVDPANNVIFEAHQYMDDNSSGGSQDCISPTIGRERIQPFVKWLRDNGKKGMIGEFAGGRNEACNTAVTDMLTSMMESSDVLVGWLWWAGGPRWQSSYPFTLHPQDGQDAPQMAIIKPFL